MFEHQPDVVNMTNDELDECLAWVRGILMINTINKARDPFVILFERDLRDVLTVRIRNEQGRRAAATKIQAAARGMLVRRQIAKEEAAATTIQAAARGMLVRRQMAKEGAAATTIQAAARGMLVRRQMAKEEAAATTIQAAARGWLVRKKVKEEQIKREEERQAELARQTRINTALLEYKVPATPERLINRETLYKLLTDLDTKAELANKAGKNKKKAANRIEKTARSNVVSFFEDLKEALKEEEDRNAQLVQQAQLVADKQLLTTAVDTLRVGMPRTLLGEPVKAILRKAIDATAQGSFMAIGKEPGKELIAALDAWKPLFNAQQGSLQFITDMWVPGLQATKANGFKIKERGSHNEVTVNFMAKFANNVTSNVHATPRGAPASTKR